MTDIISPEEWCRKVPAWRPEKPCVDATLVTFHKNHKISLLFNLEHYLKVRVERVRLGLPVSRVEYD